MAPTSLRFFPTSVEANSMSTPSSTNASLPTPPALRSSRVFLVSPPHSFAGDELCPEQPPIPIPNAPLLKDLDSFTEGTGQGSFDFQLGPCADDTSNLPLLFHPEYLNPVPSPLPLNNEDSPSSPLALHQLPHTEDPTDAVLAWREKVIPSPTSLITPKKRRRSLTQDPETDERRTRAWSPSVESSLIFCADQVERQNQPWCTDAQPPD
ncbi:hypothetical protein BJ165DRAFT_1524260 [Panaeolus papilionaceus]|nr:hypothetical protein BJ165DRAFT_1524260 [Panaeolus papilionaceus]